MITTATAPFVLEEDAQTQYNLSNIICEPIFFELPQKFVVVLRVLDSVSTNEIGRKDIELTVAEVDAETGTGSGETAPWFNALQKAVITKLEAITDNASTVFAIV
jgi:hypothetical protein